MTSARRIGALLAVTAAALAAFAVTQTSTDSGTSTRADSVWSVPAETPTTPAPAPIAPRDSVW